MKAISILTILITTIIGFNFTYESNSNHEPHYNSEFRKNLIKTVVKTEEDFAKANCFCRIGDDRGSRVKEYPNSVYDFGSLKRYSGLRPQSQKNDDDCGRICSAAAFKWANSQTDDQLCNRIKKAGYHKLVAYSKVGTRKWSIRQTLKTFSCCSSGGGFTCPSGWGPESQNFPGYCSKAICPPLINGDRRLYNKDGSTWGFIWKNMMYQLKKGSFAPIIWRSCR